MSNENYTQKALREEFSLAQIDKPVIIDQKELRKQIKNMSSLTHVVNNEIGDLLVGAEQVLELFEWLPKGEYTIKIKIQ